MIRGRGATSCLICNLEGELTVMNNMGIIYGIKLLFNTDKFNIMLMSSKICIKCAGRLHQLFDFNLLKSSLDMSQDSEDNQGDDCKFCKGTDVMGGKLFERVKEAVADTKWAEAHEKQDEIFCCFSCYNFLLLYSRIKKLLNEECLQYYKKIKSWKVILPRKKAEEESVVAVTSTSNLNKLDIETSANATIGCGEGEQNGHSTPKDSLCRFDQTLKKKRQTRKNKLSLSVNEIQNVQEAIPKKIVRALKSTALMRLRLENFNYNQVELSDKFSSIKLRRSGKRPIVLTRANIRKKPISLHDLIETKESRESVVDFHSKATSDLRKLQELTKDRILEESSEPLNKKLETSKLIEPFLQHNELEQEVPLNLLQPSIVDLNIDKAETDFLISQSSPISVHGEVATEFLRLPETLKIQPSLVNDQESMKNVLIEELEEFNSFLPDQKDLTPFTQSEDVGDDTENGTIIVEEEAQKPPDPHGIKNFSISMVRLDPDKLKKILGNRMPKLPVVSKSGRVWKPKIIIDPSTSGQRRLKNKINEKAKARELKKIQSIQKKKLRAIKKEEKLKGRNQKPFKKLSDKKMKNKISSKVIKLEYPDEAFPNSNDIVEDFVNYSTEIEKSPLMETDDDYCVVDSMSMREEITTKIEFISPAYKHTGRDLCVIDGNLLKMSSSRGLTC